MLAKPPRVSRIFGFRSMLSQGQEVEEIGETLPNTGIAVFPKTFVIEAINLGDLARFMITTEDCDSLGVSNLKSNEKCDRLDGIVTLIDIVTHKELVRVRIGPSNTEEFHQIVELTVNIATDSNWAFHWLHIEFILQELPRSVAQLLNICLSKWLAGHQTFYPTIQGRDRCSR